MDNQLLEPMILIDQNDLVDEDLSDFEEEGGERPDERDRSESDTRSKFVIKNIYYMMAYAFRSLSLGEYASLDKEDFDYIEDLYAEILSIGIASQRKRGFERLYRPISETAMAVRGRIDLRETIRLKVARKNSICCTYDELSLDTPKNRILKTAALKLVQNENVSKDRRVRLKRMIQVMGEVGVETNVHRIDWSALRFHRNNHGYQLLMNVCHMVIEGSLLSSDDGETRLQNIDDNQQLSTLYEKFIREYLRLNYPQLNAQVVNMKSPLSIIPGLWTDITLTSDRAILIIDAKCYGNILKPAYQSDKEIISSSNCHQIIHYVAREAHDQQSSPGKKIMGMLLYARTYKDRELDEHWEEIGHDFFVRTLDLGQDFQGIKRQLDRVAQLATTGIDPAMYPQRQGEAIA